MTKKYFITAIGTSVGKTIASAVLCEAFKYDYWKPIQAGNLERSDTSVVSELISNDESKVHFEKFRLETPCSPHLAAKLDNLTMSLEDFKLPPSKNGLIVEGAGGILVPINNEQTVLDLVKHLAIPVILISKNYLGSINHTLLTISKLQESKIELKGVIFNGDENKESEKIIKNLTGVSCLAHINTMEALSKASIKTEADRLAEELNELI